jgi:hypothetical protein
MLSIRHPRRLDGFDLKVYYYFLFFCCLLSLTLTLQILPLQYLGSLGWPVANVDRTLIHVRPLGSRMNFHIDQA